MHPYVAEFVGTALLMLLGCGVNANVVRFLAPITIEDAVFAEALDILEVSLKAARDAQKEAA